MINIELKQLFVQVIIFAVQLLSIIYFESLQLLNVFIFIAVPTVM